MLQELELGAIEVKITEAIVNRPETRQRREFARERMVARPSVRRRIAAALIAVGARLDSEAVRGPRAAIEVLETRGRLA
jgi:hypothetical protein